MNKPLAIIIVIVVGMLGYLTLYSQTGKTPEVVEKAVQKAESSGGYGAAPAAETSGGYGAPAPSSGGYGAPAPSSGGYGAPAP
ncbi:MAG: hypothetical protein OEL85_05705, partial [Desulfobulbaceae bacterium]|nr:hypothetical protein [Desulfobulbaceae bacterium]